MFYIGTDLHARQFRTCVLDQHNTSISEQTPLDLPPLTLPVPHADASVRRGTASLPSSGRRSERREDGSPGMDRLEHRGWGQPTALRCATVLQRVRKPCGEWFGCGDCTRVRLAGEGQMSKFLFARNMLQPIHPRGSEVRPRVARC